jgi:glycosyltransferase involved in cell wall biosynthesis
MTELPFVSIIIPCRNEEDFISKCLDSILASDYPKSKLEVLVVDGLSVDKTNTIVQEYAQHHDFIRIITNPKRITPVAFNIGIDHARGDLIMIMSSHATYNPDAIRKSVEYSREYNVDNVGGLWKIQARNHNLLATAILAVLSHPFGVGGAAYRISDENSGVRRVDTAAFGCYRREVFDRIGRYNEQLVRNQDIELNLRLRNAGGTTLLCPDIVINYYARTKLGPFLKHAFQDGIWAIVSFAYSKGMPVSWRHLVPLAFVSAVVVSALLTFVFATWGWVLMGILAVYALASVIASCQVAHNKHDLRLLFALPMIFAFLHITYGLGSVLGCAQLLRRRGLRKLFVLTWNQVIALVLIRPSDALGETMGHEK